MIDLERGRSARDGARTAPAITRMSRDLADAGYPPAEQLAIAIQLPDAEWDALCRDLREHVERERA
ncbi:MAG: hypothetical protein ACR2LK_14335 [Solirubrobacteraceae bacterium]